MRLPALALLLVTAGCVAPAADDLDAGSLEPAALADALAALEAGETRANLLPLGGWENGNGAEIAAFGNLVYVMRGGAVQILDVTDPAAVKEVAEIRGAHRVLDVKLSDDGKYLFVGDDTRWNHGSLALGQSTGGLYAYDVSDPKAAKLVASIPVGPERGPHMIFYHRDPAGREILYGANADVSIHEFDRDSGTFTKLASYRPDLVFGFNREPYVVDVLYQGWAHDMFVATEPDGKVLMYVANWDAGLRIVEVTDPASPQELGGWNDFPDGHSGNLHTVSAAWIGDRRIAVGAVEVGFAVVGGIGFAQGAEPGVVYVWDTTDPAEIELLGIWENPMEKKAGGRPVDDGLWSTHNLQLEDGILYLAHYGLGVWVLDLRTPDTWSEPPVLAYDMDLGSVWDVILADGAMWTSGGQGVLGYRFALTAEGLASRA